MVQGLVLIIRRFDNECIFGGIMFHLHVLPTHYGKASYRHVILNLYGGMVDYCTYDRQKITDVGTVSFR
jgi:hypothetical protein